MSARRLKAIILREFNTIVLDPLYVSLALLVPPFSMLVFGYGISLDVEHLPLGVLDRDQSRLSRSYIDRFIQSESFDDGGRYHNEHALEQELRTSRIRAALVIPHGFERRLHRGRPVDTSLWIDGTIPVRAKQTRSLAQAVHARFLQNLVAARGPGRAADTQIQIISQIKFNPVLRSSNFIVPGLIAAMLMFYPALLTTLSIVGEKGSGSIVVLYSSPLTKTELLLGKMVPYLLISMVNFVSMFLVAVYVFEVPFGGNIGLLLFASAIYVFATCSLGMLISILSNTQVTAILATVVATILPSFLYSGFLTPLSSASWTVWIISRFIPATYYLDILKGLFLKNTGLWIHMPSLLVLILYALIVNTISFKRFHKHSS